MFIKQSPTIQQQNQTWETALKLINVLIATGVITKIVTLATTFHKPVEKANPYVPFGYGPLNIYNHTQVQVRRSMNSYPINMIHINQQSTK